MSIEYSHDHQYSYIATCPSKRKHGFISVQFQLQYHQTEVRKLHVNTRLMISWKWQKASGYLKNVNISCNAPWKLQLLRNIARWWKQHQGKDKQLCPSRIYSYSWKCPRWNLSGTLLLELHLSIAYGHVPIFWWRPPSNQPPYWKPPSLCRRVRKSCTNTNTNSRQNATSEFSRLSDSPPQQFILYSNEAARPSGVILAPDHWTARTRKWPTKGGEGKFRSLPWCSSVPR